MSKQSETSKIETAVQLAKTAAETAKALADAKIQSDITSIRTSNDISNIQKDISEIKQTLKEFMTDSVTRKEHEEVVDNQKNNMTDIKAIQEKISDYNTLKKIVYGAVTLILVSFLSSIVYLVIHK